MKDICVLTLDKTNKMKKSIITLLLFAICVSGCVSTKQGSEKQMYRVAWKDHLTGKEGHGQWMADERAAQDFASSANAQNLHIVHWVEKKYKYTHRYYITTADLKVVKGKPTFTVIGEKKPLTDTVIKNIYLITKQ